MLFLTSYIKIPKVGAFQPRYILYIPRLYKHQRHILGYTNVMLTAALHH